MTAPFPCDAVERKHLPEGPFHIFLMASLLFAGIKISTLRVVQLMPKLLTQELYFSVEKRPVFDRNAGRLHVGIRIRVPKSTAFGCKTNPETEHSTNLF
jgi:hypothetical protein